MLPVLLVKEIEGVAYGYHWYFLVFIIVQDVEHSFTISLPDRIERKLIKCLAELLKCYLTPVSAVILEPAEDARHGIWAAKAFSDHLHLRRELLDEVLEMLELLLNVHHEVMQVKELLAINFPVLEVVCKFRHFFLGELQTLLAHVQEIINEVALLAHVADATNPLGRELLVKLHAFVLGHGHPLVNPLDVAFDF